MTVVKFSILTLLAGGFCTLLGIGMWMGPQETPCNAQTGVTAVAVADSPAPIKSCWSQPTDVALGVDFVATEAKCAAPNGAACATAACPSGNCDSGACDLVASTPSEPVASLTASAAPNPVVPRIPAATYGAYVPSDPCESGVCVPGAPYPAGAPCPMGTVCPPGIPCPPAPTFATTSFYHVAPCNGPECAPTAYSNPYGIAPAYVSPAPVVSAYASYREVEPQTSDQPSMEMIEAFMEEREKRYEAQLEALEAHRELQGEMMQAQMELKLEAQAATLQAQHQVEMTQLKAEAMVKFATMEQALREEKALLALVADGTLTTDALRAIIAKNHANGHGGPAQPVSTAAGCACEKCACETCKCGQPDASCACSTCECEGCACPGCEQAVSTAAPTCPACKTSACEASACATSKCGDCKSCDATTVVSVGACEACEKSCDACTPAPKSLERIGVEFDFEGEKCTILSDGIPVAILGDGCTMTAQGLACIGATQGREGDCTIVFGQKAAECAKGECKTVEFRMGKKSVAAESIDAPFVCEKDGCVLDVHVTEVPMLSNIPYVGRLFRNVGVTEEKHEEAAPAPEAQR